MSAELLQSLVFSLQCQVAQLTAQVAALEAAARGDALSNESAGD